MHPRVVDPRALLSALIEARVDFIVVGGAAAALHGSPLMTVDFDLVHGRSDENVSRLGALLGSLEARFRHDLAGRVIAPSQAHLVGPGQLLLSTTLGPLDCLGQLHDGRGYDDLVPHSVVIATPMGPVRVLDLPTLIQIKQAAGREKDRLALPHLLELLQRKGRGS